VVGAICFNLRFNCHGLQTGATPVGTRLDAFHVVVMAAIELTFSSKNHTPGLRRIRACGRASSCGHRPGMGTETPAAESVQHAEHFPESSLNK